MLYQKRNDFNFQQIFCAVMLFLCLSNVATAQNGMNFQGVARNTSGIILASQPIAVRLSILQGSTTGTVLYQETKTVNTNAQGIFNIVIGDPTGATSTIGSFTNIAWQTPPHFIRLEMDPSAGTNFATLGTTQLQFVAYAHFANGVAAENIVGLVPVARGGTGASTLQDLKQNLQLNNVNNTSDLNKPISTATQTALNAKINAADTTSLSSRINQKINIEDSASAYITPTQLNNAFQRLDTSHVYRAIASKASLVSPQFLSDINVNGLTVGRGNGNVLSNIALGDFALNSDSASAGENNIGIGVQTLRYNNGGTRNVAVGNRALYSNGNSSKMTAIGVGADVLNPSLSLSNTTALGFGATVDESNLIQLGNSDIQKVITSGVVTAAGFKIPAGTGNDVLLANGTTLNTSVLELNNNKSTDILLGGSSPSDVLYPSQKAVKAYVAANSASSGIADGGITTIKLADGAVTDAKVTSISGSKITGNITGATWSGTVIDIAKGGTGSSTKNFVDLTTTQTIAGNKTFSGTTNFTTDAIINSVTIGLGNNANIDNLVVGKDALITNTTGYSNLALGMNSLKSNTTGDGNIALGFGALFNNITGTSNIAIGRGALSSSTSGSRNIAIGDGLNMYGLTTGNENTSLGNGTLVNVSSGSHNTALGASANITDGTISNTTVIGYNALASTSNTIQLGNTEITSVITSGVVTAAGFKIPAGSGNDVLLANGTTLNTSVLELNNNKSTDILLGGSSPSDVLYPSQKAVKAYVAANSASSGIADGGITTIKLADGAVTDAKVTSISISKISSATTAYIAPSTNRNYVTDVQAGVISNTSGTNTGDETTSTIKTKLGVTILSGANTGDQTIALTGDITGSGTGTFTTTLANTGVTPGIYGSSSTVPVLTIDAKGRVTNITTNAVIGGGSSDAATLTGNTLASNITISSLTGVGTITTGTWSGSTIAIAKGGTGATTALAARNNLGIGTPTIAGQNNDQQQVLLGDVSTGELLYKDLYDINPTLFDDKASLTASQNIFTGDIKAKTYILTNPSSTTVSTSTTNIDLSAGNVLELVLNSTTTLSFSNPRIGTYIIKIIQGGSGNTITFPTMKWSDGAVPVITATSGRTDLLTLIYDGTNYYATCLQNF